MEPGKDLQSAMQRIEPNTDRALPNRPHVVELGRRIELQSMDPHFHDITIGLYEQRALDGAVEYLIHSYRSLPGVDERLNQLADTMTTLGGLVRIGAGGRRFRFACGRGHRLACKRLFTEACKFKPTVAVAARPLTVEDKTTMRTIAVSREGASTYHVSAGGVDEGRAQRIGAVGRGLSRLAEMELLGEDAARVRFACAHDHDALIGMLLPRALNLRAAMREQEEAMARGMLVAPSAQKS